MKENNNLQKNSVFKENASALLQKWVDDIQQNPHFSKTSFGKRDDLENSSKDFFSKLLKTMEDHQLPDCSSKTFEPIFQLWHQVLAEQLQKGLSVKDTAMLIFSLKNSMVDFFKKKNKDQEFVYQPQIDKMNTLLDFLGLFTFEIYTAEKEKQINKQSHQIQYLQNQKQLFFDTLLGNSLAMRQVYQAIGLVLENDITVLLQGESGTGKDLVANVIHTHSKRKNKPFVVINCGAIPKELIESELFGHEKGAFTGADTRRVGKIELADEGTLFLDEIGEMPMDMQVRLLRVLQNKELERIGGTENIKVNVRIVAATNKNLKEEVDAGRFRLDLYYRLNVYPVFIPPLRDRKEDIVLLANYFIDKYVSEYGLPQKGLTEDAVQFLLAQPFEGNVRELENMMQRACILAADSDISRHALDQQLINSDLSIKCLGQPDHSVVSIEKIIPLAEMERQAMMNALKITNGNIVSAAKQLGVSRATFYNKLEKYQIKE